MYLYTSQGIGRIDGLDVLLGRTCQVISCLEANQLFCCGWLGGANQQLIKPANWLPDWDYESPRGTRRLVCVSHAATDDSSMYCVENMALGGITPK
jgi:hypothetical protein